MDYRISNHCAKRLRERHIVEANIEQVLDAPDSFRSDPKQGSIRLERRLAQGVLIVWVVAPWPPQATIVVKSAAWKD